MNDFRVVVRMAPLAGGYRLELWQYIGDLVDCLSTNLDGNLSIVRIEPQASLSAAVRFPILDERSAQELMNSLWSVGLRPTPAMPEVRPLVELKAVVDDSYAEALREHIADLRRYLDQVLPAAIVDGRPKRSAVSDSVVTGAE